MCWEQCRRARFEHKIMVPFRLVGEYTVVSVAKGGDYTLDDVIATLKDEQGNEVSVTMVQKWPVKLPLTEGRKVKADQMMDTGLRILDTQFSDRQRRHILLTGAIWRRKNGDATPPFEVLIGRSRRLCCLWRAGRGGRRGAPDVSRAHRSAYK